MIRAATSADLEAISAFDVFAGDRRREIAEDRMLVAEIEHVIAAYVSWVPNGFVGRDFISFVCVDKPHRRKGLASELLRAATSQLGPCAFVSTEADNHVMLALLSREGWTGAGTVSNANENGVAEMFFYRQA